MSGRVLYQGLILALVLASRSATAQTPGASRGETYEPSTGASLLGPAPGSGANPLGGSPGAGEAILEKGMGSPGPRFIPEPFPQLLPQTFPEGEPAAVLGGAAIGPPTRLPTSPLSPYGSLALPPDLEDEGPADGLTLDQAIERLIRSNLDLYSKSFELPQAEADILTAGLRANPILYTDVQNVPYGSFSINRPGGQTQYDINVSYPLDLTRKRRARTLVAHRAKCVLEAQFQDAVRQAIDNLYTEFVDVLATRETVREARKGVEELEEEPAPDRAPGERVRQPGAEDQRLEVQREAAEVALADAEEQLRSDLRALGALLRMRPAEAERLSVRGSLHDRAQPPARDDALLRLALVSRPDLVAYRLGVGRAEADVALALANRYPDLFFMYQPYTFQNDAPLRKESATSWGVGLAVPLPLFNRNQGNILRARLNVTQTQAEMLALEDKVVYEVRQAERLYAVTRASIARIENSLLPRARQEHDRVARLYHAGKADELAFLTAERDYDQIVRQYRDVMVRHRRAMLKLNTAVGTRILP
jgi:outer membrane protein, heavy metal efflux system